MARVGYARVSSVGHSLEVQREKLQRCDTLFQETHSGAAGPRPQLRACEDAFYRSKHPVRFAGCMNTIHGRRISGPEKEPSMGEETPAIGGIAALAIDCTDPPGLAHWWQRLLGGAVEVHPQGYATLHTPEGLALDFLPVPEPKTGKNRLHLDVRSRDVATAVEQALALGATRADDIYAGGRWQVLRDPEGNEFCILRPRA